MAATKIEELRCDSWPDFQSVLREKIYKDRVFKEGDFLYRGQSNPDFKLISSFDRWYKDRKEKRPTVSQQLLSIFKKDCEADPAVDQLLLADEDRLRALAQHNGLPTRLLDWTTSPYIAAFFAFSYTFSEDVVLEDQVAVWVLDPNSPIWAEDNGAYILDPSKHGNEKMRDQSGAFTHLVGAFDTLEDYVLSFKTPDVLRKIIISTKDIDYALTELKAMNIKHSRLFQGPEGYAMDAKTRIGLEQKIRPKTSKHN